MKKERMPSELWGRRALFAVLAVAGTLGVSGAGCSGTRSEPPDEGPSAAGHADEPLYYEKMFPPYTGAGPYNVAVLGGGTAGLSTAWNLARLGHNVTVYERGATSAVQQGNIGNVQTVPLTVPLPGGGTENRWADAGLNDFNTKTYRYHTFMLDLFKVQHRPLEDSAMWGNNAGTFYQVDSNPYVGSMTATQLANIQTDSGYFFNNAWEVATDPKFADLTVDQYIYWKRTNAAMGSLPACSAYPSSGNNDCWNYSQDFVDYNLKARISNMYFTTEGEPGMMPIRGVLYYYILQEGLGPSGPPAPDRRYYVGGGRQWLYALYNFVTSLTSRTSTPSPLFPEVTPGTQHGIVSYKSCANVLSFDASTGNKTVTWQSSPVSGCSGSSTFTDGGYTHVVLATDILGAQAIMSNPSTATNPASVKSSYVSALNLIPGDRAYATMHTYYGAAGNGSTPNNQAERTYNIYKYDSYVNSYPTPPSTQPCRPYRITYIENRHQDDAHNPAMQGSAHSVFFTTENPYYTSTSICNNPLNQIVIPSGNILSRSDGGGPATGIQTTHQFMKTDSGYDTLLAQRIILGDRYNYPTPLQGQSGVFIGGGWVRGAGLQEEVFLNAVQVAAQIDNPTTFVDQHIYDFRPNAPRYAPLYIAQIADTHTTFSGTWQGGSNYSLTGACRQTFEFNVEAGHTYTISTCADHGSNTDTYLTVQDPNGTGCSCYNDDAAWNYVGGQWVHDPSLDWCSLGSQCNCTATSSGKAQICASTYADEGATWNYTVTDNFSYSGTSYQPFEYAALKNTEYQVSCGSGTGGSWYVEPYSPSGNMSCWIGSPSNPQGYITCPGSTSIMCDVRVDSPMDVYVIYGSGATGDTATVTAAKAINSSEALPTLPYDFPLQMQPPASTGGGVCTDPNRACPTGSVATAMTVWENMWARQAYLTCNPITTDPSTGALTLGSPTDQTISCGNNTGGGAYVKYDCNTDASNPAVVVGQRVWQGAYGWTFRARPICMYLKSRQIFNPDTWGPGDFTDSCPPDLAARSIEEHNGDVMDQSGLVCANVVPLPPKQTCMGTIPGTSTPLCGQVNTPAGCSCADNCASTGNCCPDVALFCQPCAGQRVGGYCWYQGGQGQSCDQVCASHGGYNDGTRLWAGTDGTNANCAALWGGPAQDVYWCGSGEGCMHDPVDGTYFRCLDVTTNGSGAYPTDYRYCACNN